MLLVGAAGVALGLALQTSAVPYNAPTALGTTRRVNWDAYERGEYGSFPQATYRSITASAPLVHVDSEYNKCGDMYTVLSPSGKASRGNKAVMLDSNGDLVWHREELGSVFNVQIQKYKGEPYITYFVGDDDFFGHSRGYYKMLDQTYTLVHTVTPMNDLDGDYHEFSITQDDTAIVTSFVKTPFDLTHVGRENGYIWDCIFQEIDIEKGQLLFEWRASKHFNFKDMKTDSWREWTGTIDDPWDWFHLNSVEKDMFGHFLVAARYSNAISYVNGKTGEIMWQLGGVYNSFQDLSDDTATLMVDPHTPRWTSHSSLVFFDNDGSWEEKTDIKMANVRELQLDLAHKTAKLTREFVHPREFSADSEGGVQVLENGNIFAGYGAVSLYAEFAPDGTLLCSTSWAPTNITNMERGEPMHNFRTHRAPWEGYPSGHPDFSFEHEWLSVSWNGATSVGHWKLEGRTSSGLKAAGWTHIETKKRHGFETVFDIGDRSIGGYVSFQLTALGRKHEYLRAWNIYPDGEVRELDRDFYTHFSDPQLRIPASSNTSNVIVIAVAVLLLWYLNRHTVRTASLKRSLI